MISFEEFYITWYARAKRFVKEYVDNDEAEDIVQDAFIYLYERRDLLNDTNLSAYLFIHLKHRCLDFLRHAMSEQTEMTHMQTEQILEMRINIDSLETLDIRFQDETSIEERLNEALEKLPEKCRAIFIMNKIEGKKQSQIAKELNLSINTVESQMAIAYKKLRYELKDFLPLLLFFY